MDDLIEEAVEEGDEAKYNKYTTDGRLNFDDELNLEGKGIFPVEQGDKRRINCLHNLLPLRILPLDYWMLVSGLGWGFLRMQPCAMFSFGIPDWKEMRTISCC